MIDWESAAAAEGNGRPDGGPRRADVVGDILSAAWQPGLPPPSEIHIRPELRAQGLGTDAPLSTDAEGPTPSGSVRVVVDDQIPDFPGYEIHRSA